MTTLENDLVERIAAFVDPFCPGQKVGEAIRKNFGGERCEVQSREVRDRPPYQIVIEDDSAAQAPINPVCDLQALLEIRDFLSDIVGGAAITERSRDTATGFVSIMDNKFGKAWASPVPSAQCAIPVCTCRPGPCSFPSTRRETTP